MADHSYILALDGGQTSTAVWLAPLDLARGHYREAPGFRHAAERLQKGSVGDRQADSLEALQTLESADEQLEGILAAIDQLLEESGCSSPSVRAVCCSLSGSPPHLAENLARIFPNAQLRFIGDAEAAYAGTLWRTAGVSLISGTGTVAMASNGDRRLVVGGWGYLFGDAGGAWGIARRAIQASICAVEKRGDPTELVPRLLAHFNVASFRDLVQQVYDGRLMRRDVGRSARIVMEWAEKGDSIALRVVDEASSELAGYVLSAVVQLGLGSSVVIGYSGGVLTRSPLLRSRIEDHLREESVLVTRWVKGSPLAGSALLALEMASQAITEETRNAVAELTISLKGA